MSRVNNNAEVAVKPPSSRLNQPGWIQWNEIRIQTQSETEWAAAWKWLEEANSNKRRIPFVVFIAFYYSAELVINVEETLRQRAPTKATGRGPRLKHFLIFLFYFFFFLYILLKENFLHILLLLLFLLVCPSPLPLRRYPEEQSEELPEATTNS